MARVLPLRKVSSARMSFQVNSSCDYDGNDAADPAWIPECRYGLNSTMAVDGRFAQRRRFDYLQDGYRSGYWRKATAYLGLKFVIHAERSTLDGRE
jgi:hypothetical protein